MDIEKLLTKGMTEALTVEELRALASNRSVFGDDAVLMFQHQADIRKDGAQTIMTRAQEEGRDMLASEHRNFDRNLVESRIVSVLADEVAQRGAVKNYVPATQTTVPAATTETEPADFSPVLTRDQKVSEYLTRRGGFLYQGEKGAEQLRFGSVIRALTLGDRRGLTPLELRVLSEGTDSSGGFSVPEVLASRFIDRVRDRMVLSRAGVVTVPMSSDTLHICKLLSPDSVSPEADTAAWRNENASIVETDLVLSRVTFTARSMAVMIKLSIELAEDSVNVDQMIERELSDQVAQELDRAILLGSGAAPQPRGIRNQAGVNVEDLSAVTFDNYDAIIDAIGRVWANGFEPNAMLHSSALAVAMAKFKSSADDQPLRAPEIVANLAKFRTNKIANANTSPDSTTFYVGDFTRAMLGLRTGFRLETTRVAGDAFSKLQIHIRAHLRADVQLEHSGAFDVSTLVGI